jgi:hypothetical protein
VDALAGKMVDDDVYAALSDGGDLRQALADAEMTAEKLREAREKKEERARQRKERIEALKREAQRKAYAYEQERHSAAALLGYGHDAPEHLPGGELGAGLPGEDDEARRRRLGLCSPKQALVLKRKGLDPEMSWTDAKYVMGMLQRFKWQVPEHIKSNPRYRPKAAP